MHCQDSSLGTWRDSLSRILGIFLRRINYASQSNLRPSLALSGPSDLSMLTLHTFWRALGPAGQVKLSFHWQWHTKVDFGYKVFSWGKSRQNLIQVIRNKLIFPRFFIQRMVELWKMKSERDHIWPSGRKRSHPLSKNAVSLLDVTRRRSSPAMRGFSGDIE